MEKAIRYRYLLGIFLHGDLPRYSFSCFRQIPVVNGIFSPSFLLSRHFRSVSPSSCHAELNALHIGMNDGGACNRKCANYTKLLNEKRFHTDSYTWNSASTRKKSNKTNKRKAIEAETEAQQTFDTGFEENLTPEEKVNLVFDNLFEKRIIEKHENDLRDTLSVFINAGCDRKSIETVFDKCPHLLRKYPFAHWESAIHSLLLCGFHEKVIVRMIAKNPHLLHTSSDALLEATDSLRQVFKSEHNMLKQCVKQPSLLTLDMLEMGKRYEEMNAIFPNKDLQSLLNLNPDMLLGDTSDIQAKLDYVMATLNVPEQHIAGTRLFSHSFQHIVTRSEFLIKSGLYVKPNKHGHSPALNAKLRDIVDTTDAEFSRKVAQCSIREYETFCAMFEMHDIRVLQAKYKLGKGRGEE